MSLVRVLVTTEVTLTHTFYVDEVATDLAAACTVTLKRLDGTVVVTGPATHPGPAGVYTFAVPEQATVDLLTMDWSGTLAGAVVSVRDYVEVVGGFLFGLAEARQKHPSLANIATYPSSLLASKRIEVEQECERICRRAFVPRFARIRLSGNDTERLPLPWNLQMGGGSEGRVVRAASISGTVMSAPDVAALGITEYGVIKRPGGAVWPSGTGNIIVEYEHGWDYPPADLAEANILRLRSAIASTLSGIPDRAISFAVAEGGTFRLSTPSKQQTGIPDVDGTYEKYTRQQRAVFA
jgi:hypothetical protein